MALRTYIGGVLAPPEENTELVDVVRLGDVDGFEEFARMGDAATPDIRVDDPDGELDIVAWKGFYAIETEAPEGDQRIATYYVARRTIDRMRPSHRTGDSRTFTVGLAEINTVATFRVLKGLEAKRPAESVAERLEWLLGTEEFGTYVADRGFVDPPDRELDATDYRKMRPVDVLNDCAQAGWGSNWFVYHVETDDSFSLFFAAPDAVLYTSNLSLSNVRTDVDNVTTFYVEDAERLERDPSDINDGVLVVYGDNSMIYRNRPETHDVWAIHRDGVYDNPRIGRQSTAESFAQQYLIRHSTEDDTIFCTVELPAALVNEIRRGMRVQVRFQHIPGYDEPTYLRVVARNVRQSTTAYPRRYQIDLELSNAGPTGGGGGGGGTPPEPWVPCTPTFTLERVQYGHISAGTGFALPSTPAVGHLLVAAGVYRNSAPLNMYTQQAGGGEEAWTIIDSFNGYEGDQGVAMYWRIVTEDDLNVFSFDDAGGHRWIIEYGSGGSLQSFSSRENPGGIASSTALYGGSVSPDAGVPCVVVAVNSGGNDFQIVEHDPASGWFEIADEGNLGPLDSFAPKYSVIDRILADPGVTETPSATIVEVVNSPVIKTGGITAVFTLTAGGGDEDCPPPVPGQPVAPLEIAVSDCATLDYVVPTGSYRAGTLHIYVRDGSELRPVLFEQTDPDTGRFRLLESPCTVVPTTTEYMTIYDAVAEEWKFMFLEDGTPMTIEIGGSTSSTLPTLVVEYIAGVATTDDPGDPGTDPPDPEPPVDPPEEPGTNPAFGTRTAAAAGSRDVSGGSSVLIEDISINGGTRDSVAGIGITIQNVTGTITIRNVDLQNLIGGIYLLNCSGTLIIENVRSRNIGNVVDGDDIGSGHGNHIQLNNCTFRGVIQGNQFLGGKTEDMISLFESGGISATEKLYIQDNRLQGLVADTATTRAWDSTSGTGIIIGDGPGSGNNGNTVVRRNTLLTPGQVGIQHIDGPGIETYDNLLYGAQRPKANNAITSFAGDPSGSVHHNRYYWFDEDGNHPSLFFGAGTLDVYSNVEDPTIDPADLVVNLS